MRRIIIASLLSLSTACFKRDPDPSLSLPPPVAANKCLVARYVGALAVDQTCNMSGYSWHCTTAPGQTIGCVRGAELSEASAAPAADAGVDAAP